MNAGEGRGSACELIGGELKERQNIDKRVIRSYISGVAAVWELARLVAVLTWLLLPQRVGNTGETGWGALLGYQQAKDTLLDLSSFFLLPSYCSPWQLTRESGGETR